MVKEGKATNIFLSYLDESVVFMLIQVSRKEWSVCRSIFFKKMKQLKTSYLNSILFSLRVTGFWKRTFGFF